jgi:hypothetical protein
LSTSSSRKEGRAMCRSARLRLGSMCAVCNDFENVGKFEF